MKRNYSVAKEQLEQIRLLIEQKGTQIFSLLEDLPIAMCVTDRSGTFKTINQHYCQVYGYEAGELLGKNFTMVVPESKREILQSLHDDFIKNTYELQGEWFVENKQGSLIKILASAAYVEDDKANPYKVTFLIRLMESFDLESRLENVINLLSSDQQELVERQLLFHDLKNDLVEDFSLGDLLGMYELNPERYRQMEILLSQDQQALNVIDILSGLLQMEKRIFVIDRKHLDLIKLIRKILLEHTHLYQEKNISFNIKIDEDRSFPSESVSVEGDEIYLELMFQNLFFFMLNNSEDYNDTDIVFRQNDHIIINIEHKSENKAKKLDMKPLQRLKHFSFLVIREHGGDITFSQSRKGGLKVTIILPHVL